MMSTRRRIIAAVVVLLSPFQIALADGWDPETMTSNLGSILNTRHNLTQSFLLENAGIMNIARSDYGEVCVYCHTPHGASTQTDAPLWNRTVNVGSYQIYDAPRTLNQPIGQPGLNSITCLSCHDGTMAIDSVINMPGSGGYDPAQMTTVNEGFLDTWGGAGIGNHWNLSTSTSGDSCGFCHNSAEDFGAPDFSVFTIGTDLTNDHPVGIMYPDTFGPEVDFNEPTLVYTPTGGGFPLTVFDINGDGRPDKNEPRMYNYGGGARVECASCHDPHGVPSAGPGSKFNPSFLRVNNGIASDGSPGTAGIASNVGSALCLTCHNK